MNLLFHELQGGVGKTTTSCCLGVKVSAFEHSSVVGYLTDGKHFQQLRTLNPAACAAR